MARTTSSAAVAPTNAALSEIEAADQPLHKTPTTTTAATTTSAANAKEKDQPTTTVEQPNSRIRITRSPLGIIFYLHILIVSALAVVLNIRGFVSPHARSHFHPSKWYPPLLTSVGLSGLTGLAWQALTHYYPKRAIRVAFWLSPLLTLAMGFMLIYTGSASGLGLGVVAVVMAVVQSLYGCWASPRFDHAVAVVAVAAAFPPRKTMGLAVLVVVGAVVYCGVLMAGVGGATAAGTMIDKVFIAVMVLSMAWTMQVTKNLLQVAVSSVKYLNFSSGSESDICTTLRSATVHSVGPIISGSVLVPLTSLIHGSSRGAALLANDSDEFLFSCTDCYSSLSNTLVSSANRWGFVHVGVYGKAIIRASSDTWEMFQRAGMEELINLDLTSSFCFFCGLAGGALSCVWAGVWSIVVQKEYATEVSVYGFFVGYFVSRVAMAWPQACVSAYYVAFAENPESARFDATIPVRLQQLHRHHQV